MGCHALLQGIFPTPGLNPQLLCLLHWRVGSLPLAPPEKPPVTPKWVTGSDSSLNCGLVCLTSPFGGGLSWASSSQTPPIFTDARTTRHAKTQPKFSLIPHSVCGQIQCLFHSSPAPPTFPRPLWRPLNWPPCLPVVPIPSPFPSQPEVIIIIIFLTSNGKFQTHTKEEIKTMTLCVYHSVSIVNKICPTRMMSL